MVNSMCAIWDLEQLINMREPKDSPYKCKVKIDYECSAFVERKKKEDDKCLMI